MVCPAGTLARSSPPVPDPDAPAVLTLKGWLVVGCIAIRAACDCVVIVPNRGCILREEGVETYWQVEFCQVTGFSSSGVLK